jgi:hypothetical protein
MTESIVPEQATWCLRVQEDLLLLEEGILVAEEESALRSHLLGCTDCQRAATALAALKAAMPTPPGDLGLKILAGLLSSTEQPAGLHEPDTAGPRPHHRWLPSGWGVAALAASLLLAFIAGIGSGHVWPSDTAMAGLDPLAFVDPDLDGWAEEWLVAGAPVLEALSDETLYLLAMELDP